MATSSGVPNRPAGISDSNSVRISSSVRWEAPDFREMMPVRRSVSVAPGSTLFTVMPKGASSVAKVFAQLAMAPRVVLLTPRPSMGCFTLVDTMLIKRPYDASFILWKTSRIK